MTDRSRRLYRDRARIDVVRRDRAPILLADAAIGRVVAGALAAAGAPAPASVTVVLTDDLELTDLNRAHMGIDGPTDVLSFPMLAADSFPAGRARRRSGPGRREPRTHIGDIAISVERAMEQADQGRGGQTGDVRWSPADELRLLVVHGTLHLCGFDHVDRADEAAMRALERRLLEAAR
ncbi:MAG TPA: rRNA maturation RNase YbeY [Candidatus Limnocylindrales bacterium]|nr:rRNA maturation RNase YbeY [Candidatus Limnocylindrales bacterium]